MVKKGNSEFVINALNNGSLSYNIFIDDIQRAINEESPLVNENDLKLIGRQGLKIILLKLSNKENNYINFKYLPIYTFIC